MTTETTTPRPGELTHKQLRPHVDAMLRQFEASAGRVEEKVLTAKVKALGRACEKLLLGAEFEIVGFDRRGQLVVRFQSESMPDQQHLTMARGCRCIAGGRSRVARKSELVCWHAPARALIWLLAGKPEAPTVWTEEDEQNRAEIYEDDLREAEAEADFERRYAGEHPGVDYVGRPQRRDYDPAPTTTAPAGLGYYVCPVDRGTMAPSLTPARETCVECQSCGHQAMDGTYDALEPLGDTEAAGVARVLGRAA